MVCLEQLVRAMYSALVEDRVMVYWTWDLQLKMPFASLRNYPVYDHLVAGLDAQSKSV